MKKETLVSVVLIWWAIIIVHTAQEVSDDNEPPLVKNPNNKPPAGKNPNKKPPLGKNPNKKPPPGKNPNKKPPTNSTQPENEPKLRDVLFILVDDLGWNDVSFHGSEIPTPNIDALAMDGVILHNYYVQPQCTPSRAALMTAKMPSKIGMQKRVIVAGSYTGLPTTEKIMPQYFKEKGYKTHLVGKWHLGGAKEEFWPTRRGYDSFFGHLLGGNDYFEHRHILELGGLDLWQNELLVAPKYVGSHSTDIYKDRVKEIYNTAKKDDRLFVVFSPQAVHTGNTFNPYQVLKSQEEKVKHIKNDTRRQFAALVSGLDDAIAEIVQVLKDKGRLGKTIIVFSTDNGAVSLGTNNTVEYGGGSNWPLRGTKGNAWEGGIRGVGFIWSKRLKQCVSKQVMHIVDLLPTLYTGAGLGKLVAQNIDGIDLWQKLEAGAADVKKDSRNMLLLKVDEVQTAYRMGKFKYIKGRQFKDVDGWYCPPAEEELNAVKWDQECEVDKILVDIGRAKKRRKKENIVKVECLEAEKEVKCDPNEVCLFDLENDACEIQNIKDEESSKKILEDIEKMIQAVETVPPLFEEPKEGCKPQAPGYAWWPCALTAAPKPEDETTMMSGAESTTKSEDESTTKSEDESTTKSADESTTKSEDESTTKSADESTTKSEDESTTKSEDETTKRPGSKSTKKFEDETTTTSEDETTTKSEDEMTTKSGTVARSTADPKS